MNWNKKLNAAVLILLLLTGCALSPERDDTTAEDAAAKAQAEALLRKHFANAVELMESGRTEKARAGFEQIVAEHPGHTGPLANLGVLAYQAGDMALASSRFKEVLALNPEHPVALNYLGVIARKAGDFLAAEKYYRAALAANPEYVPALLNLAFLLDIYLGEPEQALPLYEQYKALATEPDPRLKDWIFDAKNRI